MSRSNKPGKRKRAVKVKTDSSVAMTIVNRHTYGSTEKILRRNRKTWTRLGNKRRRAIDKAIIDSE